MSNIIHFPKSESEKRNNVIDLIESGQHAEALEATIKLIDEGNVTAYVIAGFLYDYGNKELERDIDKAKFYYEKAVEENGDVEAFLGLGRIYYYGLGVHPDYEMAYKIYSKVESESDLPITYLMLGKMFDLGKGVDQDKEKAKYYYNYAAEHGLVFAKRNLALVQLGQGKIFRGLTGLVGAILFGMSISLTKGNSDSRMRNQ